MTLQPLRIDIAIVVSVAMPSVLVVSQDSRFLDHLGASLRNAGMLTVCVKQADAVMEIVEEGFRPNAVVVEPGAVLEPGGSELVQYLTRSPALASIPIFSISGVVKRLEMETLIAGLRRLGEAAI